MLVSFFPLLVSVEMVVCFPHRAFNALHRASHSTLDTTGVGSVLLPLRYNKKVMTSPCGLMVGKVSPGDGERVPFYLVGDVVAY